MTTVKRIVCLANSRKLSHRCVAGIELDGGSRVGWVRPVSQRPKGEVRFGERVCTDGKEPNVRDVLLATLIAPQPRGYQTENWLVDQAHRWERNGRLAPDRLPYICDPPSPLWVNGHHTATGENDEIPLEDTARLNDSLRLIHVEDLTLSVFDYYKRRVRGSFDFMGSRYCLSATDPVFEEPYKAMEDGDYHLGACWLTISLTEPFEEREACYKVIAAIIREDS